ncbi:malic enzyme-like NAD(P)-binding protein [Bacillus cereus]|jgi:malate dehydrogenase (oxaloacetate-decarboxylating)|uniref:Malate dehydrogenase (Oxaloacetate-decarboxylating) n=4 Tax=Bacillus cereus group TaxID=86661 RepID=A0A9W5R6D2_BACCE|nr:MULTISPECIES: malic enzyme-like NAD(P)-binding protein [Bacillus]MCX2704559.1 NAD-dependent malic enzyme [Bacillus sp. AS_5]MEB4844010.1 malic enzyme-like NAD(P)-binding protein [Paenibacillus jamilae]ACK62954.1 putative malate dehydrogenase [Bacillus cereus B4264]ASI73425.1 malate dehydrogenase [Bacillus cereus]ASI84143.1 NADP-dependent malic enzyme [Bacillus cereus]
MSPLRDEALKMHKEKQGKIGVYSKVKVQNSTDLSLAYSPGVAEPCLEIYKDESKVYDYTMKGNLVGVISDGTAVLGLGNIGPKAAMPVMEGKALLFKSFAEIDAFPICLNTNNPDKIVEVVKLLELNFGGINLEDIAAPQCFEIEERLRKSCDIPVFHDDQHGTAIVTIAGLINALKLTNKKIEDVQIVVNGAGAAGIAIVKLLLHMHVKNVILCDTKGIVYEQRPIGMNALKEEIARITNIEQKRGRLAEALIDADVFIGVSAAGVVDEDMVRSMNHNPIIFALANPTPEIMPNKAKIAGALVVGTGRSDFPNQVNNVLAFPGVFRGALDVQAKEINEEMKLAAVYAIADLISEEELHVNYVIPNPFDPRVVPHVAYAVARAAVETGVSRKNISMSEIKNNLFRLTKETNILK